MKTERTGGHDREQNMAKKKESPSLRTPKKTTTDHPQKIRRVLRVVAYNALFTFAGLILIAIAGEIYLRLTTRNIAILREVSGKSILGEVYLRLTTPPTLISNSVPKQFVQGVGLLLKPNTEVRYTDNIDYFTISRTNSLGFLDREPISPERASASCHIAMIGDSFVEAKQVSIANKFHVRLEELAARHLPHLDITTSAFGRSATGQINQLPFYDEFARHLSPKLVVLVFVNNDFANNSTLLYALSMGIHPDRQPPYVTAARDVAGTIKLRPPHPDWSMFRLPQLPKSLYMSIVEHLRSSSYFMRGLEEKIFPLFPFPRDPQLIVQMKFLNRYFNYKSLFNGLQPKTWEDVEDQFEKKTLSPFLEKELAFTAFALDQFKERTDRDGASLVILATYTMGTRGHPTFDRLNAMAEARGIPIIDQYDYIRRQGGEIQEAYWAFDEHWNVQGHQWAAEALLEYVKKNPEVCTKPIDTGTP